MHEKDTEGPTLPTKERLFQLCENWECCRLNFRKDRSGVMLITFGFGSIAVSSSTHSLKLKPHSLEERHVPDHIFDDSGQVRK